MAGKRKSLSGGDQLPSDAPSASGVTASAKKVNRRSSTPTPGKPEPPSDRVDAAEQRQRAIEWAQRLESLTIGGESVVKKSPAPKKVSKKVDAAEVSAETTAQVTTSTVEVTTVAAPAAKKAPRKSIGSSSDAAVTPATGEKRVRVRKPKAAKDANASPAAVKIPAEPAVSKSDSTVAVSECTPACSAAQARGFAPSTAMRIVLTPVVLAILVALYLHYPKLFYVAVAAILVVFIMRRIMCALLMVPAPMANLQPPPPAV